MPRAATFKLIFFFAALLFAAKPFIGFGLYGHFNSPVKTNIFAKVFSKRKTDDCRTNQKAIEKILARPLNPLLRFSFLLALLFPVIFKITREMTNAFISHLQLRLVPQQVILFTGQLLI